MDVFSSSVNDYLMSMPPFHHRPGTAAEEAQAVLTSYVRGQSACPHDLGLSRPALLAWLNAHFINGGDVEAWLTETSPSDDIAFRREVRAELAAERAEEIEALEDLLHQYVAQPTPVVQAWARIVAHACLGSDHLWSDLGLTHRPQLRVLLHHVFPVAVARNTADMRWKRFFYRMLCEQGGDYICRAPSCEQCSSYRECFAPGLENPGNT